MANTFDAGIVVNKLAEKTITVLQNRLPMLSAFSTLFSDASAAKKASVIVPVATAGATTQTNATNFESGDSTLTIATVALDQYTQSYHLTNAHLQNGYTLDQIAAVNAGAFADKIIDVCLAPVTVANFGAASVTAAAASFDIDDLRTLYNSLKKASNKTLVLDSAYYARFAVQTDRENSGINVTGFGTMHECSRWTGAGTNVVGFVCDPAAIAIASNVPETAPAIGAEFIQSKNITLPALGLTVQMNLWANSASRETWASLDVLLGAVKADTTALKIVTSA